MKKRLTACLCALALALSLAGTARGVSGWEDRLEAIRVLGIMVGDENGDMALERPVTRCEFVKMMTAASAYKDSVGGSYGASLFKDVKSGHWASEYIKLGVEQGWFNGYTDGTFRPENTITLEEACTALLRLLGYDASSLAGAFPAAQLSKASAVGLLDEVEAVQGQELTRRECVSLFYDLLTAENSGGALYGATLGYTISNGEVDYASLVTADLKGPYVYAGGSVSLPFDTAGATVYRDGALSSLGAMEQYDVYYYNANLRTVWVYVDRAIGILSEVSPSRVSPTSVTVAGKTYGISTSTAAYQLSSQGGFADEEPVTLLLDKDGAVAQVLHGVHGELDEDEYAAVLDTDTQGPYVVSANGALALPFDTAGAEVYLNGAASSLSVARQYDVYYYNATLGVVWLYRDKVTGTLTQVSPSRVSPTAVTVAGKSYEVGTSTAKRQLSSQGSFSDGDIVTLLLGMNGEAVEVLSAQESQGTYYGVVTASAKTADYSSSTAASSASVQVETQVACTDGAARTFYHSGGVQTAGSVVQVTVDSGGAALARLSEKSVTGAVNAAGTRLGSYALAADVEILDSDGEGNALRVYPSRLAGATLRTGDVRYYTLNADGAVDRLILDDVTGDLGEYVYVTATRSSETGMSLNGSYTYLKNGESRTVGGGSVYSVKTGGAMLTYEDGSLKAIRQLTSVQLGGLSDLYATASSGQRYDLSEDVQVLLRSGTAVYPTTLGEIDDQGYDLVGWYDDFGCSAGGRIRILVATAKG